jgi:glycerol-3-phosphate acyltransferase PlsY
MINLISGTGLVLCAYLIGSFPYMLILSRARGFNIAVGEDFHLSVWRRIGRLEGASGVAIDVIKGILPVAAGFLLDFPLVVTVCAGVASVIGQMWPIFQKFNGEKGNTTGGGMALALTIFLGNNALLVLCICVLCFLAGFLVRTIPRFREKGHTLDEKMKFGGPVSNGMPLGMLAGFVFMPLASWLLNQPLEMTLALAVMFIAIVIRRLTANLGKDLRSPQTGISQILINRLLFDRSYYKDQG